MTETKSHFAPDFADGGRWPEKTLLIQHLPVDKHFGLLRSLVDVSAAIADHGEEDGQCG
jgi:hypothetical protein